MKHSNEKNSTITIVCIPNINTVCRKKKSHVQKTCSIPAQKALINDYFWLRGLEYKPISDEEKSKWHLVLNKRPRETI